MTTNRRSFIKLAEGVRAAGEFSLELRDDLFETVRARQEDGLIAEGFDLDKFRAHALSESPISPRRIFRHMHEIEGYERVLVKLADDEWVFGAYVIDGENWNGWAIPYFTRTVARELVQRNNDVFADEQPGEVEALEWDEDGNLLLVAPDSANDFADENASGIKRLTANEHGLFKFDAGWTWKRIATAPPVEDDMYTDDDDDAYSEV